MPTTQALLELSTAMKRKLLNVNQDLREERHKKYPDAQRLAQLKQVSKRLDRAYSACLHCAKEPDPTQREQDYKTLLALYQRT